MHLALSMILAAHWCVVIEAARFVRHIAVKFGVELISCPFFG